MKTIYFQQLYRIYPVSWSDKVLIEAVHDHQNQVSHQRHQMRLCARALPSARDFSGSVNMCVNSTRSLEKNVKRKLRLLLTALGGTFKELENSSVFLVRSPVGSDFKFFPCLCSLSFISHKDNRLLHPTS